MSFFLETSLFKLQHLRLHFFYIAQFMNYSSWNTNFILFALNKFVFPSIIQFMWNLLFVAKYFVKLHFTDHKPYVLSSRELCIEGNHKL